MTISAQGGGKGRRTSSWTHDATAPARPRRRAPARASALAATLRRVLAGEQVVDLARQLFLSAGTVRNHLSSAIRKTGTRTRIEAVRAAEDRGWL